MKQSYIKALILILSLCGLLIHAKTITDWDKEETRAVEEKVKQAKRYFVKNANGTMFQTYYKKELKGFLSKQTIEHIESEIKRVTSLISRDESAYQNTKKRRAKSSDYHSYLVDRKYRILVNKDYLKMLNEELSRKKQQTKLDKNNSNTKEIKQTRKDAPENKNSEEVAKEIGLSQNNLILERLAENEWNANDEKLAEEIAYKVAKSWFGNFANAIRARVHYKKTTKHASKRRFGWSRYFKSNTEDLKEIKESILKQYHDFKYNKSQKVEPLKLLIQKKVKPTRHELETTDKFNEKIITLKYLISQLDEDLRNKELENQKVEKNKYPLRGKAHTPIKLYKNIYSGLSMEYFNKLLIEKKDIFDHFDSIAKDKYKKEGIWVKVERNDYSRKVDYVFFDSINELREYRKKSSRYDNFATYNKVEFLLSHDLLPITKQGNFIQESKQSSIFINSKGQILNLRSLDVLLNTHAFISGIKFELKESENINPELLINKFKKDYPNLKQDGTIPRNSFEFIKDMSDNDIKELSQIVEKVKQKFDHKVKELLKNHTSELSSSPEMINIVKEQVRENLNEVENNVKQSFLSSRFNFPQREANSLTLANENVVIFIEKEYYRMETLEQSGKKVIARYIKKDNSISVTIMDKKLVEYRDKIKKDLRNAIKEYNEAGRQKQKQEELKQLDF